MTVAKNEPPIFSTVGGADARLGEQDAGAASRAARKNSPVLA